MRIRSKRIDDRAWQHQIENNGLHNAVIAIFEQAGMVLSTSDRCIVSGDLSLMSDNQIRFGQMENNDNTVSVGDQIVTSYISDKYLQGILIGYVSEVTVDSNNLTRSGYITPAVDFKNLQEVLVITTTKADLVGSNQSE